MFVLVHGAWHGAWCWEQVESSHSPFISQPERLASLLIDLDD
jgi:hypothetical protein